ncbi:MAG: hypothetical protein JXJ04_27220 [Spirochaetales bacterium]|nr:hypothetical protein [Spirochaetales bacterium]
MKHELNNIKMGMTWTTYVGSVYGIVQAAGLWQGEVWELMGMSGMAFQFIVHETACPSSTTVYDWKDTHFHAMDRVGLHTDSIGITNQPGLNTFTLVQTRAINLIKESIDNGRGVVVWAPSPVLEFGIIRGYDDAEKIFEVLDCINEDPDPLLYDNLGRSEVPMLYIQWFLDKVDVDPEKIYRDSLQYGVWNWEQPHFNRHYAKGRAGYDNLAATLEQGNYNPFGLTYIVSVYADSKKCLANYLDKIGKKSRYLQSVAEAAELYARIAEGFETMSQIAPFRGPGAAEIDKERIPEMINVVRGCQVMEDKAMAGLRKALEIK